MWHLVCGDAAVEGVSFVLGEALAGQWLRVLRDDLAVGPLVDVDTPPCAVRAAFWRGVWPASVQPVPVFESELADEAAWLSHLASDDRSVTVWHGDSASEQLLLARVASMLQGSAVQLWEVACGSGDSRVVTRKAVSMRTPQELKDMARPQLIETSRRSRLSAQWRQALAANADVRRWQAGEFKGEDYRVIDASLLGCVKAEWQPLGRAMAGAMAQCDGFFATDYFLGWRARELTVAGVLELDGPLDGSYVEQRVRLAV